MTSNAYFLILNGEYEEAIKQMQEETYEGIVSKGIALYKIGKFEEANTFFDQALVNDNQRYEGFYWRGVVNFTSGKIQQGQQDLLQAQKLKGDHKDIQIWLQKCELELKNPKLVQRQQEKIIQQQPEILKTNIFSSSGKLMYKWYQTDLKVGIEIQYSLQNSSDLKYQFQKQRLSLSFPIGQGNNFELELDLFGEILPDTSKVKVGLSTIEILMDKTDKTLNWTHLQRKQEVAEEIEQASYPSSSKRKKDWNKIDKEIEEDMSKHKEEYGIDPLNSLFQQIYQNGDENTRKAMVKSMSTSGGTVLSTNWDEVSKKDYERKDRPSPPKGQEYKKLG